MLQYYCIMVVVLFKAAHLSYLKLFRCFEGGNNAFVLKIFSFTDHKWFTVKLSSSSHFKLYVKFIASVVLVHEMTTFTE